VILVPVGNRIEPGCDEGLRTLERRGYPVRRVFGYSAIDQARSQMATDALADGFEWLMWIDADVVFEPRDVDRLRTHERPFICGIYPKKGVRAFAANFASDTRCVKFGRHGGLVTVPRIGFGFALNHRDVYARIRDHARLPVCNRAWGETLVPYFMPMVAEDDGLPSYLAEDFAFCERATAAGISIFVDTTVRLWHVGTYPYGWEDAGRDVQRHDDYSFFIQSPE
jgi:hypothetical protein